MSIANTPDHGFILSGVTNGSDGDVPFHYGIFYSFDWLVIKIDSTGNMQWSKDIGGTGDEGEKGNIFSIDNSYYLVSAEGTTYGNFAGAGAFISYIDTNSHEVINKLYPVVEPSILVFPNPSDNKINILAPDNGPGNFIIINSIGQGIYEQKTEQQKQNTSVNIAEWANGVYLIKWQGADGRILTAQFVKS